MSSLCRVIARQHKIFIQEIKSELNKVKNTHDVILDYTQGHTGSLGNEMADELANRAAIIGNSLNSIITTQLIKIELKERNKD